ncbi:MAG: divalent-cation tolerance protein CutA [Campylobacteraceae bacterium]|nr:divalent-cation tolerance protein CutA [Campylobacteraceae bacterium]
MIIIQTSTKCKTEAKYIASVLIKDELAACIQISKVESLYMWKKKIENEKEFVLTIKTKRSNFKKIKSIIKKIHSYDLPEIISFKVKKASKEYKEYIYKNVK